ncbi:hypothetical protein HY640_00385 [Candidatus Woesearchaeota archaeon]|nr:hypothetical protein [Candidatus Woesearchaeota archaeon]
MCAKGLGLFLVMCLFLVPFSFALEPGSVSSSDGGRSGESLFVFRGLVQRDWEPVDVSVSVTNSRSLFRNQTFSSGGLYEVGVVGLQGDIVVVEAGGSRAVVVLSSAEQKLDMALSGGGGITGFAFYPGGEFSVSGAAMLLFVVLFSATIVGVFVLKTREMRAAQLVKAKGKGK